MTDYTDPKTQSPGDPLLSADWNTHVRDNVKALKDLPSDNYEVDEGVDYTPGGAFADVDGTNLKFTITTFGGDVLIGWFCSCVGSAGGSIIYFDVKVDTSLIGGDDGLICVEFAANKTESVSFIRLLTGLSAGVHTFSLQAKFAGGGAVTIFAGAGTANFDVHPGFFVREV